MNLKKIFTYQEEMGGLEISDSKLRIAFLDLLTVKGKKKVKIKKWAEVELAPGIIDKGEIKNKQAFLSSLKKLLKDLFRKQGKVKIPKVVPIIISLPSQKIYTQLFRFPRVINQKRLEAGMKLAAQLSLPLQEDEIYLDWELVSSAQEEKQALLALVRKAFMDEYVKMFEDVEFVPIACEFYSLSLNRLICRFESEPFCIALVTPEGGEISISIFKSIRFVYSFYWQEEQNTEEAKKEFLKQGIWKAINFYQTDIKDSQSIKKTYLVQSFAETSEVKDYLEKELKQQIIVPEIPFTIAGPTGKLLKKKEKIEGEVGKLLKEESQKEKERKGWEDHFRQKINEIEKQREKLATEKNTKEEEIRGLKKQISALKAEISIEKEEKVEKEEIDIKNRIKQLQNEVEKLTKLEKQKKETIKNLAKKGGKIIQLTVKKQEDLKTLRDKAKKEEEEITILFEELKKEKETEGKEKAFLEKGAYLFQKLKERIATNKAEIKEINPAKKQKENKVKELVNLENRTGKEIKGLAKRGHPCFSRKS